MEAVEEANLASSNKKVTLCSSLYAYALGNGSVGVYDNTTRLWRTKSKVNIASIMVFPTSDYLACVWAAGKVILSYFLI